LEQTFQEIRIVLQDYFDGWHEADAGKLSRVFHPACHLFCVINGALDDDDMEKVYASVRGRQSPASRGEARVDKILAIDVAGPQTALAKVQLAIGPKLFTDNLSLLKLNGRWQIISKTFSFEPLPNPPSRQVGREPVGGAP